MFEGNSVEKVILKVGIVILIVAFVFFGLAILFTDFGIGLILFVIGFMIMFFDVPFLIGLLWNKVVLGLGFYQSKAFFCPECTAQLELKYIPYDKGVFKCRGCELEINKNERGLGFANADTSLINLRCAKCGKKIRSFAVRYTWLDKEKKIAIHDKCIDKK
jgi:hypothetical protein